MTAAAKDRHAPYAEGLEWPIPVGASKTIFGGTMVCVDGATGYAEPGSDASGKIFAGISTMQRDNSSGSAVDCAVVVKRRGLFLFPIATAITQANVGDQVFIVDDQTVDLVGNVTYAIHCGTIAAMESTTLVWIDIAPAVQQTDVATHIADTSGAHAASAISIADAGGFTEQTTVEGLFQELLPRTPVAIADPGDAGAIPVTRSGSVALTTTGAETRTLAIPGLAGITIAVSLDVDGGDAVITAAAAINQTGNNTITLDDAGDTIVLTAVQVAGALIWRVAFNDGCSLSTV